MSENKFKVGDFVIKDVLEYVEGAVGISFRLTTKRGKVIDISLGPGSFGHILTVRMESGEEFSDQSNSFKYDIEKIRDSKIDDIGSND